ncbi:MAG TPA: TauD/TfdA family dioxygenase [Dehalococcoidia bacterium]|nr:TauD/TfdA family dioxygenase [Dehalococcoidia bacterium]
MSVTLRKLHPLFAAEVTSSIELRSVYDEQTLSEIRAGMDEYAVLVFHAQPFTDEEQLAFAERLDGQLNRNRVLAKNRFNNDALVDISNVDETGEVMDTYNRRRMYNLGNRLWHTDASFNDPRGRYSMLHARVVPEVGGDTEFADLRAAYDALPEAMKTEIEALKAHHSVMHSRQTLGFEDFSKEEAERLEGAIHPLVHTIPGSGRRSLYIASHASRIIDWPVPDGRLLLLELRDHAVQQQFRYTHSWEVGDLVIWDNRATMHRGLPYEDTKYRRELRRVTTLDVPLPQAEARSAIAVEAVR